MEDFKSISVSRTRNKTLKIHNPTNYKLIGQGKQGAVFQLTPQRCVKIFALSKQAKREREIIKQLEGLPFMPKVFETGENYIVMEYVEGVPLDLYLKEKKVLDPSLTIQILSLVKEMKPFNKTDIEYRHILVTKDGELKKIDHGSRSPSQSRTDKPYKILKMLDRLNLYETFLKQVKDIDSDTYMKWKR
nr:AarF/UbiB family protein [Fredinandcohnia onubensis]